MGVRHAFLLLVATGLIAAAPGRTEAVRDPLPVLDAAGLEQLLSEHSGKVVLLNFWATWCRPCLKEIPALQELSGRYSADEFILVPVSLDDPANASLVVTNFLNRWFPDFSSWLSAEPEMDAIVSVVDRAWNEVLPTSYVLNRNGSGARRLQGGKAIEEFDAAVQAALQP